MRISDWSSDVCSSDLLGAKPRCAGAGIALECGDRGVLVLDHAGDGAERTVGDMPRDGTPKLPRRDAPRLAIGSGWDDRPIEIGRASCRERECQYVAISVVAGLQTKKTIRRNKRGEDIYLEHDM